MARDTELDRLKAAQDLAFQRKQRAYETMQAAWQRRSSARDEMNRAFEVKQCAHEVQEASWRDYQRVKRANGPRIDQLNSQQEAAYQNMRRAFDNASMAYDRRDGAAARSHADDGHAFKAEAQRYVEERRRLVAEIRAARDRHAGPKADFQRAKADFTAAKQRFDQAKAEHECAKDEFQRAKREFDVARQAFKARLEKVRAERNRRREDKRAIAERAGVPSQYLDDLWVSRDSNGNTNIYFGGVGKPNGPGHGHYVVDRNGRVTYRRNPNDPHGSHNFVDNRSDGKMKSEQTEEEYIDSQRAEGHSGGWGLVHYGFIDDLPVTFAMGWGTKEGHTLLADGHVDKTSFRKSENHDHYGSGKGAHGNVKYRGRYTGPGA